MSAPLPAALNQLAALRDYLRAVEDSLQAGAMPDLTGLDHRIAGLCHDIEQVEEAGRGACLAELKAVLQSLDTCRAGLLNSRAAMAANEKPSEGEAGA